MVMSTGIIEQAVTEISLMQLAAGGLPKRRRRKYRNHEKRHTSINKEEYEAGDYIDSRPTATGWNIASLALQIVFTIKITFKFRLNGTSANQFVRRNGLDAFSQL